MQIKAKLNQIFLISLIYPVLFTGCSNAPDDLNSSNIPENSEIPPVSAVFETALEDFFFVYDETLIYLDEDTSRVVDELATASDFYEVDSCTFEGTAKLYSYAGFDISTYQKGDEDIDRIYSIDLIDDTVSTREGISIGQTFGEMIAAYGENYEEIAGVNGFYEYTRNHTVLSFHFQDDVIATISYKVTDIYAE